MSHIIEESIETNRVEGDSVFKRFESFVSHTTLKDPFWFRCFAGYCALVLLCYLVLSYNTGKHAFFLYTEACKKSDRKPLQEEAWIAVQEGISKRGWRNMYESIVVPYTFACSVMPYVVMYFNKVPA